MVWIAVWVLIAIVLLVVVVKGILGGDSIFGSIIGYPVLLAIAALFLLLPALAIGEAYDSEVAHDVRVRETEVLALQNVSEVGGELSGGGFFVLATGGVSVDGSTNNEVYYVFYHKDARGEVKFEKKKPGEIRIFEEDRSDAVFQRIRETTREKSAIRIFGIIWGRTSTTTEYHLRVPEGTIMRGVSLALDDLK